MKTILLALCLATLVSCERKASEAEVSTARERIAEQAGKVGYSEAYLQHAKEPGEVALATEDLRDEKDKLERMITESEKLVQRAEASKIAGLSQVQSRESMLESYAENAEALAQIQRESDEKNAATRREIEQNERDVELLRVMLKARRDGGSNDRIDAQIDAQTKKAFPNGAPFGSQFELPEN